MNLKLLALVAFLVWLGLVILAGLAYGWFSAFLVALSWAASAIYSHIGYRELQKEKEPRRRIGGGFGP